MGAKDRHTSTGPGIDNVALPSIADPFPHATRLLDLWEQAAEVTVPANDLGVALLSHTGAAGAYARWATLTQTVIKHVHPSADAHVTQKNAGFDARTFAKDVTVPFNQMIGSPLGHSTDPYVSEPLRVGRIGRPTATSKKHKNPELWAQLCDYVDGLQAASPADVEQRLLYLLNDLRRQVQVGAARRDRIRVSSSAPVSQRVLADVLLRFMSVPSGGRRPQIALSALAEHDPQVTAVTHHINASDTSTGNILDIDLIHSSEGLICSIEVKDYAPDAGYLIGKIRALAEHERVQDNGHISVNFVSPTTVDPAALAAAQEEAGRAGVDARFSTFSEWIHAHTSTLTVSECSRVLDRLAHFTDRHGISGDADDLDVILRDLLPTPDQVENGHQVASDEPPFDEQELPLFPLPPRTTRSKFDPRNGYQEPLFPL